MDTENGARRGPTSKAVVAAKKGVVYLYMVTDAKGHPVYIGGKAKTMIRPTAVPGISAPRLRKFLEDEKARDPEWDIRDHVVRLPECPDGAPEDRSEELKCYFIYKYHTSHGEGADGKWNGKCNIKQAGNVTSHEDRFEAIRDELRRNGGVIELPSDHAPDAFLEAHAEQAALGDLLEDTRNSDNDPLDAVQQAYAVACRSVDILKGKSEARVAAEAWLADLKKQQTLATKKPSKGKRRIDDDDDDDDKAAGLPKSDVTQSWNSLMSEVANMELSDVEEQMLQQGLLAWMKYLKAKWFVNGDALLGGDLPIEWNALKMLAGKVVEQTKWIDTCAFSGQHSLQSRMAWTQHSFKIPDPNNKGGPKIEQGAEKAMENVNKFLADSSVPPAWRAFARTRRASLQRILDKEATETAEAISESDTDDTM